MFFSPNKFISKESTFYLTKTIQNSPFGLAVPDNRRRALVSHNALVRFSLLCTRIPRTLPAGAGFPHRCFTSPILSPYHCLPPIVTYNRGKGGMDYLGIDIGCAVRSLRGRNFPERECLLPLISKLLGYLIVAFSTTVKLPQILKILNHRSASGISVTGVELEIVGYTVGLGYCIHKGLPFSAYGELSFLLIQGLVLIATIYYYSQPVSIKTWIRALIYCAIAPTILGGQIDPFLFETLYACQHIIFLCARVPQIWQNFNNKGTGQLSFLTCLMNFGGSMVRVFTSIQEKAPSSVIMGSTMGALMNGTILGQIIIYQKPQGKKEKKDE